MAKPMGGATRWEGMIERELRARRSSVNCAHKIIPYRAMYRAVTFTVPCHAIHHAMPCTVPCHVPCYAMYLAVTFTVRCHVPWP